jgi:hypothetical protein
MALMWLKKEKLEDTNEVMKCPNRRKADNAMAKRKEDKRTSYDLQGTTQKMKDRVTRSPLKLR